MPSNSGFLGSPRQVELVRELIHTFRTPKTWVVIDPVMGDGGSLYSSCLLYTSVPDLDMILQSAQF